MWCSLNESSGGEGIIELSIAKDDWGEMKAGVSFQEYVSCDIIVTSEVQILE